MAQINKSDEYFNTLIWTGDGVTRSITGVNFQPDFVWIKKRSGVDNNHVFDVVRGAGNRLLTDSSAAEGVGTNELTAFNSDGFTLSGNGAVNGSGATYVGWNWLGANGTASNTNGSITSTVSANTTSGFSIVSYTGTGSNATVGHGLGTSDIGTIIVKNRDSGTDNWWVFHKSIGATGGLKLNATDSTITASTLWNDTAPTSSVFSIGTGSGLNASGQDLIAYVMAEKKGFSKFGSYTGNGSTDGTFVYTGFKPAWVMVKRTTNLGGWVIYDNKRDSYNVTDLFLYADTSDADVPFTGYDFLSNGFKARTTGGAMNSSGDTFIYMAFAENPLVGTNNIPATAR